jgi:hypothetical protein
MAPGAQCAECSAHHVSASVLAQGAESTDAEQGSVGSRRSRLKEGLSNLIGKGSSKEQ